MNASTNCQRAHTLPPGSQVVDHHHAERGFIRLITSGTKTYEELPFNTLKFAPKPISTQSFLYKSSLRDDWVSGNPWLHFRQRLRKTWNLEVDFATLLNLNRAIKSQPPRQIWPWLLLLQNEWPTYRRMRHVYAKGSPTPPCRFCGEGADCVRHFFTDPCIVLVHQLKQEFDMRDLPNLLPVPTQAKLLLRLLPIYYSVYTLLRWSGVHRPLRASIREARWVMNALEDRIAHQNTQARSARRQVVRSRQRPRVQHCACGVPTDSRSKHECLVVLLTRCHFIQETRQ